MREKKSLISKKIVLLFSNYGSSVVKRVSVNNARNPLGTRPVATIAVFAPENVEITLKFSTIVINFDT